MAFSKEARIITLLVTDIVFFLLELITGYAVGSLALVADSFHMLNDVMSLVVALYAVRLVNKKRDVTDEVEYTYGLQRAEILGALVNGVFLLALCFSIFMEALERLFNVTEVQNPKLVVIVGSLGLASNIVGLFLFHDHGHSHGGHSHGGHSHGSIGDASHSHTHGQDVSASAQKRHARERSESVTSLIGHPAAARANVVRTAHDMGFEAQASTTAIPAAVSTDSERQMLLANKSSKYGATSTHAHAHDHAHDHEHDHEHDHDDAHLEEGAGEHLQKKKKGLFARFAGGDADDAHNHSHGGHSHSHGGHSHGGGEGSMNMQGVFLHVLGDALGNVGVIAAGLFIWFSSASWRFYSDPAISFIITIIIFHSALPLVKSASFILLQGVPNAVPFKAVKESLLEVKGVLSVHELHIWQLSESKNVASVHVLIDVDEANLTDQQVAPFDAAGTANAEPSATSTATVGGSNSPTKRSVLIPQEHRYMDIAAQIRGKLHRFNIHSSTIQPEFVRGGMRSVARANGVEIDEDIANAKGTLVTKQGEPVEQTLSRNGSTACLIACGPDGSCVEASCCPPSQDANGGTRSDESPRQS